MTFAKQLSSAVSQTDESLNRTWKISVSDAFNQYVQVTPFKDGFARGSYVVAQTVSEPSPNKTTATRVSPQEIPNIGSAVSIYSSLPYMNRLDTGWSEQAPNGMTSIVTANWAGIVKKNERR